jgi:prepilin-type N-terminal cleavage/methylation domain-containing protein
LTARREKGFTLIETLIAVAVLAVMLLTLISVFIYGYGAVARARQTALATVIAQEEMEAIRALPFDQIAALGSTFSHAKLTSLLGGLGVLAVEAGPGVDIKKVSVSVLWTFRGVQRRKDVVTFMTRKGINKI